MGKICLKILFYLGMVLLLSGAFTYYKPKGYWVLFFLFGYSCLILFYLTRIIRDCIKKERQPLNIVLQILCILMSVVLLFKYYPLPSLDYFSLLVVPVFIITSIIYLAEGRKRYIELTFTVILYFYLSLPLFGIVYRAEEKLWTPRHYIPVEWYNPSDFSQTSHIRLTHTFETDQTEKLYQEADSLISARQFKDALNIFLEVIAIEPNNVNVYFTLANCYNALHKSKEGIEVLDRAIAINDSLPYLFHNRGLMHSQCSNNTNAIADLQRSIALDSSHFLPYINLALIYCYEEQYQEAWEAVQKAEKLGGGEMLDKMSPNVRAIAQRWK